MGISNFFSEFLKSDIFKNILFKNPPNNIEGVSIDLNGTIHEVAQQVYGYGKNTLEEKEKEKIKEMSAEELEEKFFIAMGDKLAEFLEKYQPRSYFIMCVDGIAPPAKANQQRSRRYTRAMEVSNTPVEERSVFNNAAITPGTELMIRLDNYLQNWVAQNREVLPATVVYSSHLVPGEGEQKIFNILRSGVISEGNGFHLTIGLDADLVMLSSLCKFKKYTLVRNNYSSLNIENFREELFQIMTNGWEEEPNMELVIQDFVLMVFLLGNDFLPHNIALGEVWKTMEFLLEKYNKLEMHFTDLNGNIDWNNFGSLTELIAENEPKFVKEKSEKEWKFPSQVIDSIYKNEKYSSMTETEKYVYFRTKWYNNALFPRTPSVVEYLKQ